MKTVLKYLKTILKSLHNNNGFTLIEAVVTVAIVGIVVGPISIIFQSVLSDSMETKEQLKATQLAQQYVEAFRVLPYEELIAITDGGTIDDLVLTNYDLPELLAGMELEMNLVYDMSDSEFVADFGTDNETTTRDVNYSHDFQLPTLNEIGVDYDMLFYMDHLDNNKVDFYLRGADFAGRYTGSSPTEKFPNAGSPDGIEDRAKTIDIKYSEGVTDPASVKINYTDGASTADAVNTFSNPSYIIAIYCDADGDIDDGFIADTIFNITNHTSEVVQLYIYRSNEDKIAPTINIVNGDVVSFDQLESTSLYSHRIYELEVKIKRDGEYLAEVTTTIIAK